MSLIETQAVRAILVMIALAAVFVGVAFAGLAGFAALVPHMDAAWAALIAAGALILPALIAAFVVRARARARATPARPQAAPPPAQDPAMALIAGMAQDKPLLAVLFAGILGAAGTILQNRARER